MISGKNVKIRDTFLTVYATIFSQLFSQNIAIIALVIGL